LILLFCFSLNTVTAGKTNIFFGNGMFNTYMDAFSSMQALSLFIRQEASRRGYSEDIEFFLAYNRSEAKTTPVGMDNSNVFQELSEVIRQRGYLGSDLVDLFFDSLSGTKILPTWLRDKVGEINKSLAFAGSLGELILDSDLLAHVSAYRNKLYEGGKVVLVAHSQGNLYANNAYNLIYGVGEPLSSTSFGIVYVATPDSTRHGGFPYTTLTNDWIINFVQTSFPLTLAGNITNTSGDETFLHHNFIDAYLAGNESGPKIVNDVFDVMENYLTDAEKVVEGGDITVTLTWGHATDVDLHVFEPNGNHVYYSSKQGTYGRLDVDNQDGYGPEHYYSEQNATGQYIIAVNYFSGLVPETAYVVINAGSIQRVYTVSLPSETGSAGNSSPQQVAVINATYNSLSQSYEFSIQ
jgi:hypothetical protein